MNIYVIAASDAEQDEERKLRWGDYWLKRNIERALVDAGHMLHEQVEASTDVLVHCWGLPVERVPEWTYNVLYIHSHPAALSTVVWGLYDRVIASSERLAARLREQGVRVDDVVTGATDFEPLDVPLGHDVVFVGNNRGDMRPVIAALGDLTTLPFKLEVWGEGWQALPEGIWQGEYIPYDELNRLYASSAVVLNDTHADMIDAGIINPRVLDALASGSMVIDEDSDDVLAEVTAAVGRRRSGWNPPAYKPPTYADMVDVLVGGIEPRLRLDLGCGKHKRRGFVGVDMMLDTAVDVVCDLRQGLPYGADQVDYAVADNLMEHIGAEFIPLMNDLHRAIKPSGRLTIRVPGVHSPAAAFGDPTHVRYFAPETFDYFDVGHARWHAYGEGYGIRPWRLLAREVVERFIEVVLQPHKEREE